MPSTFRKLKRVRLPKNHFKNNEIVVVYCDIYMKKLEKNRILYKMPANILIILSGHDVPSNDLLSNRN